MEEKSVIFPAKGFKDCIRKKTRIQRDSYKEVCIYDIEQCKKRWRHPVLFEKLVADINQ